jgi:hypothetical protein
MHGYLLIMHASVFDFDVGVNICFLYISGKFLYG